MSSDEGLITKIERLEPISIIPDNTLIPMTTQGNNSSPNRKIDAPRITSIDPENIRDKNPDLIFPSWFH